MNTMISHVPVLLASSIHPQSSSTVVVFSTSCISKAYGSVSGVLNPRETPQAPIYPARKTSALIVP